MAYLIMETKPGNFNVRTDSTDLGRAYLGAVEIGGLYFDKDVLDAIAAHVVKSRPQDITVEEAEVVRLERVLEQAVADGVIGRYVKASAGQSRGFRSVIIHWNGQSKTCNGDSYIEAARAAVEYVTARRAELEAANAAEAEAQPEEPQQTICAECKHVLPDYLCGINAKRDQITGEYVGPSCTTKRGSNNPTEPCPDYEAREDAEDGA